MRRIRFSVAMSLDGYIAGPNGEFDWIIMDPDIDFGALMGSFDTVLMGRKSYDVMQQQGDGRMPNMETYVFSRTLPKVDHPGVILSNNPAEVLPALKSQSGKDIWLFGGGILFRSLLELRLVDAIEVAVIPVLLGDGLPLLPRRANKENLQLVEHRVYEKTGITLLEYALT